MPRKIVLLPMLLTLVAGYLVGQKFSAPPAVLGAARPPLSAPPAEWVVHDLTASGTAAVATRPAGGAGVQHVVDCISATVVSAPGGANAGVLETVELVDGSLGVLMSWELAVVNGADGVAGVHVCGLSVVGSANEPMTLEFPGNIGYQSVNMTGHDAT